jgi:type IV pilus assembly protein PilE
MTIEKQRDSMIRFVINGQPVRSAGYTLIELAIVVTILGILGSIAVGNYSKYLVEGCRVDGQSGLETLANKQAQFYFDQNRYAPNITSLSLVATDPDGHYTLTTSLIGTDSNRFTATAVQSTAQTCLPSNDIQYRINHTGFREHKVFGGSWVSSWE